MSQKEFDNFVLDLVQEVRNLAKYHPDAVYHGPVKGGDLCCYTEGECKDSTGETIGIGCIMGQAILNIRPEMKRALEKADVHQIDVRCLLSEIGEKHFDVGTCLFTNPVTFLASVQQDQDLGSTWGDAVEESIGLLMKQLS